MQREIISIDFEFIDKKGRYPTPVCVSLRNNHPGAVGVYTAIVGVDTGAVESFWLYKSRAELTRLKEFLQQKIKENAIFLCYGAGAEASCFRALGLETHEAYFIDLWAEWRILRGNGTNSRFFKLFHGKSPEGLINACAGLTGVKLDYEHKDKMRSILMSGKNIEEHRDEILKYCEDDIIYLCPMWDALAAYYKEKLSFSKAQYTDHALARGAYSALLDTISADGIPMDMDALKEIDRTRKFRIRYMQDFCNRLSPKMFQPKRKMDRNDPNVILKYEKKTFDDFLKEKEKEGHVLIHKKPTETQAKNGAPPSISTDLASLKYYEEVLGIKTPLIKARKFYIEETKYLDYFNRKKGEASWDDYIGDDERLRPFFSPFGSKTMRNYPPAKCFPPVRPNAIRKHVLNDPGTLMVGIDYKSQEFAIGAIMSQDKNMLNAYRSGDVYVALAKQVGQWDDKKSTRFIFKVLVLSIIYGSGLNAITWELRTKLGLTPDEMPISAASVYYNYFWDTYSTLQAWQGDVLAYYLTHGRLYLPDGTVLWDNNKNQLSVKNWPIQAMGGAILRNAQLLIPRSIQQVWPVHDAVYIRVKNRSEDIVSAIAIVKRAMTTAWYNLLRKNGRNYVPPGFDVTLFGKPEQTMDKKEVDLLKDRYTILPYYQKA